MVHSDYFSKNQNLRAIATLLVQQIKSNKGLDKMAIWQAVFSAQAYDERKFNNYISDLLELTYQLLMQERFAKEKTQQYAYLQQELIEQAAYSQANRIAKKWKKAKQATSLQNTERLYTDFQFHSLQNELILHENKRVYNTHLQDKSTAFEHYYLLQQLMNYAEILNRKNVVKGDSQLPYLQDLLDRYQANKLDEQSISSISIYVQIVEMLIGQGAEIKFENIQILMLQHHEVFTAAESRTIYNYLINFCVKQINSGKTAYYQKLLLIYKALIDKQILLLNEQLSPWTYTNIITVGIRLQEWEWTEHFLEQYQAYLPLKDRHNAFNYNLAAIHFERKEYDKAWEPLNEVAYTDAFYQMAAKSIQLKIYYNTGAFEAFEALAAASRQFISRNKQLSEYQQKSNLNFIRLLQKMFAIKEYHKLWPMNKRKQRVDQLKNLLDASDKPTTHRAWLLSALNELSDRAL